MYFFPFQNKLSSFLSEFWQYFVIFWEFWLHFVSTLNFASVRITLCIIFFNFRIDFIYMCLFSFFLLKNIHFVNMISEINLLPSFLLNIGSPTTLYMVFCIQQNHPNILPSLSTAAPKKLNKALKIIIRKGRIIKGWERTERMRIMITCLR